MATALYEMVKKSKEDNKTLQMLIELFEPKINKALMLTEYKERENLSQEIKFKLIVGIKTYDVESTPGFWELKEKMSEQKIK